MIYQTSINDISPFLDRVKVKLGNTKPLMDVWASSRSEIFDNQFDNELDPENKPLRNLSTTYLKWKEANYPGRKKRELTGRTLKSRQIRISKNTVTETIDYNGVYLQNNLDLRLQPDDWTNPISDRLINDALLFLDF